MKMKLLLPILACAALTTFAEPNAVSGDYLEVRSCDVYTGPCFANSEMGLAGKEALMFWSIREGGWNGANLEGLGVAAVVKTSRTLGNLRYQPRSGKAILIVDARADAAQREALAQFARAQAGSLISEVVRVETAPIESSFGGCAEAGCASLKAGGLVQATTSCLGGEHDVCGNEKTFYPPLTELTSSWPAFTDLAAFTGEGLNVTWRITGTRSAFLGTFSAPAQTASTSHALGLYGWPHSLY